MKLIYLIACFIAIKLTLNFSKYLRCKYYSNKYFEWLAGNRNNLTEHKSQVINLLKGAGVPNCTIGYSEPIGWGYLRTGNASVFENFPNNREDVAQATVRMMDQAIGVYRSRMIETISPLYWMELVINFPQHLLAYLGLSSENVLTKIAQLAYWATAALVGFLYALYKSEFESFIKTFIEKLLHR